jgi:hypothetical protein
LLKWLWKMPTDNSLLPESPRNIPDVKADTPCDRMGAVVSTRDHVLIRQWAEQRKAEPATGEATRSGPATVHVEDGGAGVRFNFPGHAPFRSISWEEWFENFDSHGCAFVYDNDSPDAPQSLRYRIVNAAEWRDVIG